MKEKLLEIRKQGLEKIESIKTLEELQPYYWLNKQ